VAIEVRAWNGASFEPSTTAVFARKEGLWIPEANA
jgi:hypothetical protein